MEATGYIEIRITGKKGGAPLSPENFDISEIRELLSNFEDIVFASSKKQRPVVSYEQQEGSLRSIFRTKSQIILGFAALLGPIKENPGLEFLQIETARGIESLQDLANAKDYNIEITTSASAEETLTINRATNYHLASDALVDADFYLYGEVSTIGGKKNPSLHVDTEDYGVLVLKTNREELQRLEENPVYKVIGVHAKGKQSARDFEIDRQSLELVSFLEYAPKKDRTYMDSLIRKASKSWEGISDPEVWLRDMRGGEIAV